MCRIFLIMFLVLSCSKDQNLSKFSPGLRWDPLLENSHVILDKEFQEKKSVGLKISFEGELKGHVMVLETYTDVDEEQSKMFFKNKGFLVEGMYAIQATPYSGTITKAASCLTDMEIAPKEVEIKNQVSKTYSLKATDRLVQGVCIEEQNVFKNQIHFLYCKNSKTFYDIRYFYKKNIPTMKLPIANCKN